MSTSADKQNNTDQIAYWNDRAAVTWMTFQERLDALFEPLTALALDAAAPNWENAPSTSAAVAAPQYWPWRNVWARPARFWAWTSPNP